MKVKIKWFGKIHKIGVFHAVKIKGVLNYMDSTNNFHLSLLYFSHILINVDNNVDENELKGIQALVKHESIDEDIYREYVENSKYLPEQDIFNKAVEGIVSCTHVQKLQTFAWLYKLSESDGNVHDKEIKFLLFSIKYAGIDLEDAISASGKLPNF